MTKNRGRRLLSGASVAGLGVVFLTLSTAALGQSSEFRPAQFGIDNRLNQIKISPGDMSRGSNTAAVRCQGFVEVDGSLSDYHCITDEFLLDGNEHQDGKVLAAVIRAIPEQTFEPAMIRGEKVRVLMNFSVFVSCSPKSCLTIAARHHGYHLLEYGFNYVAPQPILVDDDWYSGFDYKLKWIRDWMPNVARVDRWPAGDRIPYTIAVKINADGTAHNGCLYWFKRTGAMGWPANRRELERARDSIGAVRYIPGFYEKRPVAMRLYESSVLRDDRSTVRNWNLDLYQIPRTDCQSTGQAAASRSH